MHMGRPYMFSLRLRVYTYNTFIHLSTVSSGGVFGSHSSLV